MKLKKLFSLLTAVAVVAGLVNPAMLPKAAAADDFVTEVWTWAHENGLTTTESPDAFRGYSPVTRAEEATFVWRFAKKFTNLTEDPNADCSFVDLPADPNLQEGIVGACKM